MSYRSCCGVDEKEQHTSDCPKRLEIIAHEMTEEELGPFVLWHDKQRQWIDTKNQNLKKLIESKKILS
jgi:hypothetical protein